MFTVISVVLIATSVGSFLIGSATLVQCLHFRLRARHTTATIKGYERRECEEYVDGHQRTVMASFPIFTFIDDAHREHTVTSSAGGNPSFPVGATVPSLYDPANPSQATIDTFWFTIGVPLFLTGVSLFTLAGSLGFWYVTREVR